MMVGKTALDSAAIIDEISTFHPSVFILRLLLDGQVERRAAAEEQNCF